MATLNQISERIAYAKNDPFNIMLLENIKFSVKYWRSMLIRRDIERNGLSDEYLQKIWVDLEKVDKIDPCNPSCGIILRTKYRIPKPVRIKSDVLFKFVGGLDQNDDLVPFTYVEGEELRFTKFNRFTSKSVRFCYVNGYLEVYNNTFFKKMLIQTPFSDPSQVNTMCDEPCYNDDMEFPCPDDMIQQIVAGILGGELQIQAKPLDPQVKVDDE